MLRLMTCIAAICLYFNPHLRQILTQQICILELQALDANFNCSFYISQPGVSKVLQINKTSSN
ncbi:hypothetical protein OIU78_005056 [Salix suchowensis]|nr:hypothetical protein OIU78_005056 [Salix suchowensis]